MTRSNDRAISLSGQPARCAPGDLMITLYSGFAIAVSGALEIGELVSVLITHRDSAVFQRVLVPTTIEVLARMR